MNDYYAKMRLWFEDGTSVVLGVGDTLKCFTATRIVRVAPEFHNPNLPILQGTLQLVTGTNWSGK